MKMCNLDMMDELEFLSATFEALKRLNGVYILIFHFAQQRFRFFVKKKFCNCCQRAVPTEPENDENATDKTAETQL